MDTPADAITSAAEGTSPLTIHPGLQLAILSDFANGERANWSTHEAKLKQHGIIPLYLGVFAPSQRRLPENVA